ncbi:MAG TPA: isochorismate synthase, partial [Candidatus Dormibacteraeota bacterium]|nr:isochorismate synthase [Candidatus Dormibacteraeota bacterium]
MALAAAARERGHLAAVVERPMPEAVSVAAVGSVAELVSSGGTVRLETAAGRPLGPVTRVPSTARPGEVSRAVCQAARLWERWAASGSGAGDPGLPGTGLIGVGGFAFRPDRDPAGSWAGFPALLLRVPELAVVHVRDRSFATLTLLSRGRSGPDRQAIARGRDWAATILAATGRSGMPPVAAIREVVPSRPEAEWSAAVGLAIRRLSGPRLQKVVLAREVVARADGPIAVARLVSALRGANPGSWTYAVDGGDGTTLVGSSPELLIRRHGRHLVSEPLAGSAARGASSAADERLARELRHSAKNRAEHQAVVEGILGALRPLCQAVHVAAEPRVRRLPTVQHLATVVTGLLPAGTAASVLDLAAALHPTAAIAGTPRAAALRVIDELEALDRGWYGGAVGWIDARGDGEFALALRCGLLWEDGLRLFAGAGIMPD